MKKILWVLVLALCVLMTAAALGEETVSFQGVTAEKTAEYVDMGETAIGDLSAFQRFLSQLPALKKVDMFATPVERQQIEELTAHFPNIQFGWTIHIARDHYIRTDATAFSTLHGVCPGHSSKDFEVLKYCPDLMALDLGHNDVTSLKFLTALPKLRVLILAFNPISDLSPLAELKDLEYLELFTCDFSNITPLAELPHLLDLNLSYNPIYQFNPFLQLSPTIQRLWVSETKVYFSPERIRELQAALPNARFNFDDAPTAHGWRDGEHYDKIYDMFHTGVYQPFSDSFPFEE